MSIDTADERLAVISFGRTFSPLIIPNNSINTINKATLLGCYSFFTDIISSAYITFQLDINQSYSLTELNINKIYISSLDINQSFELELIR